MTALLDIIALFGVPALLSLATKGLVALLTRPNDWIDEKTGNDTKPNVWF